MRRRDILLALALLAAPAYGELLPIRAYTTSDGLASDHVTCIVSDSRGFLWFCTDEGLSRFDGYRFTTYTSADGLANDVVATVLATRSGELFAGTRKGISRINSAVQGAPFTTYLPDGPAGNNDIKALFESRSGKIWCATRRSLYEW